MDIPVAFPDDWTEYELIDSGDGEKLERFNTYTLIRPDPRALWSKHSPERWELADASFKRTDPKTGDWLKRTPPPVPWLIHYNRLTFTLRPTEFKHVGIFPEQAVNWKWLDEIIRHRPLRILNLFAYTGGATMAAISSGAIVTHVDAAKSTIAWAKENLRASGLPETSVRWIEDDAYKFVLREGKRNNTYDGIILDPPRFGRGSKGEIWKLENDLPKLLSACKHILSPKPAFVLINAYTPDISSIVLHNMLQSMMESYSGSTTSGELTLKESASGNLLPNGIFARWSADH